MTFLLGNFLWTCGLFVELVSHVYSTVVIASVILSWLPIGRGHPVVRAIDALVEPVLRTLRRHAPFLVQGGIDFSPWALLLAIQLVQSVAGNSLLRAASELR